MVLSQCITGYVKPKTVTYIQLGLSYCCMCVYNSTNHQSNKKRLHKGFKVVCPPSSEVLILKGHRSIGWNHFNSVVTLSWPSYNEPSPNDFTISGGV